MEKKDRLAHVKEMFEERGWTYKSCQEDGCESIDFEYRGVSYIYGNSMTGNGAWRPMYGMAEEWKN